MDNQRLLKEVMLRSKNDEWCQQCCKEVDRHAPAYEEILRLLTPEQEEQLELYIGACEAWCSSRIFVAYRIGREHGEIAAYRP